MLIAERVHMPNPAPSQTRVTAEAGMIAACRSCSGLHQGGGLTRWSMMI